MSYKDWYTINKDPNGYVCVAVDKDLEFVKQYGITMEGDMAGNCGCFAGHTMCRHKQMVTIFNKANRVGSRWYYNFDKKKWREPPQQEN